MTIFFPDPRVYIIGGGEGVPRWPDRVSSVDPIDPHKREEPMFHTSIFRIVVFLIVFSLLAGPGEAAELIERPWGLFVCRGPSPTPDREVDYPFVRGWLVRPGWNQIEPEEGRYDWTYIDNEIAHARKLKKKIA